jgi:hypothetical protein
VRVWVCVCVCVCFFYFSFKHIYYVGSVPKVIQSPVGFDPRGCISGVWPQWHSIQFGHR